MVGFAADGASVMFGEKNSVAAKLKADIPHIFLMKCVCHSLALAVSYAAKVLPDKLNTLFTDIYRYLKYSSKRQENLQRFQTLFDIPQHKILRLFKIRWLSLGNVVSRFLEQYDALNAFFDEERKTKIKKTPEEATKIFEILQSRFNLLYLQFLNFILPLISKRNLEFQAEKTRVHELHAKMESLFKTVAAYYLDDDYVECTDPELLAFTEDRKSENPQNWTPLRNIELGPAVIADLARLPSDISAVKIDEFRNTCRSFFITLCDQIYKRLPFASRKIQMMKKLEFLDPQKLSTIKNITEVSVHFGVDHDLVHKEYRLLKCSHLHETVSNITKFWKQVAQRCTPNGEKEFPLLTDLVERILVLPHSSATVERIFSAINLNKTKTRNRLNPKTLSGLLHTKELGNIYDFKNEEY